MTTHTTNPTLDDLCVFRIDVPQLLKGRALITATSGAGKTWAARRLVEQTNGHAQQIVIDPEGELHTLREHFDFALVTTRGGDAVASVETAGRMALRLLELGTDAVIDLYELGVRRADYVKAFLEGVMEAPRELWHPTMFVIEEAQKFCPERGEDPAVSDAAVKDLMTRGRKRGFAGILSTQRIAALHKAAAAECINRLVGRTTLDVDQDRAAKALGLRGASAAQSLRGLDDGHFFVVGPAFGREVVEVSIGSVKSTHEEAGAIRARPAPARAHIKAVLGKLADLQTADPADLSKDELRAKIRELEAKRDEPGGAGAKVLLASAEYDLATVRAERDTATDTVEKLVAGLDREHGARARAGDRGAVRVISATGKPLKAPFPWFGGKSLAAPLIWRAFGNVPNYVEPFAGSLAVLLARPHAPKVETANDKDGLVANFWRAVKHDPAAVTHYADWPVNEADLHARHRWLVKSVPGLLVRLYDDPDFYDPKIAGWWVWGICTWIGNGWCSRDERLELHHCLPRVGTPGNGLHAPTTGKKPLTHRGKGVNASASTGALPELFQALCDRLRDVRICCGDWMRIMGDSTLGVDSQHGMTPCGILLDPPYAHDKREKRLYSEDDASISGAVREWAIANGDNPSLRIALCGWAGEHAMPAGWTQVAWRSKGSGKNRGKERIWFSRHCAAALGQRDLFGEASPVLADLTFEAMT